MKKILVLYYSRTGHTEKMARSIATGVEMIDGCESVLRSAPELKTSLEKEDIPQIAESGAPYIKLSDFEEASALILGSPTRFGNMAAPLKHALDQTGGLWMSGGLVGKPAAVFTSTGSMHGGQETTLTSMMLPLLHQGMLIVGLPYTESSLMQTTTGGTPYGASHYAGAQSDRDLDKIEKSLCVALGKRVADLASHLKDYDPL